MSDILENAITLIENAQKNGIELRLLGGLAIKAHSLDSKVMEKAPFLREYDDMDFAVSSSQSFELMKFFREIGLGENRRFNSLNGKKRMIFYYGDEDTGTKMDIFVGNFEMCHNIDFNSRLINDIYTVPLAELFLTKLQIVQINQKDITDTLGMMLAHEVGENDDDKINCIQIGKLCGCDWGLYHTIEKNIGRILYKLDEYELTSENKNDITNKMNAILKYMSNAQKSLKWVLRSKIGEAVKWYEEPEDAERKAFAI
jgi:hypothetical protein